MIAVRGEVSGVDHQPIESAVVVAAVGEAGAGERDLLVISGDDLVVRSDAGLAWFARRIEDVAEAGAHLVGAARGSQILDGVRVDPWSGPDADDEDACTRSAVGDDFE